jgi:iron complex transport system substrate-binding protein
MKNKYMALPIAILATLLLIVGIIGCDNTAVDTPDTPIVTKPEATTKIYTDLKGNKVEVPIEVNKVFGISPIETNIIYALAPDKLGGWNMPTKDEMFPAKYKELPLVGGWFGTQSGNYEAFLAQKPDVIFGVGTANYDELKIGFADIPVLFFYSGSATGDTLEPAITLAGEILGAQQQAQKLLNFYNEALDTVKGRVADIPDDQRVKVYYAEGKTGLLTDPPYSPHASLIEICGGINVADVDIKKGMGQTEVSLEQIIAWNPDIIIIGRSADASVRDTILTDPNWKAIKAVQDKKVFLRPSRPLSWFDGPPSVNQIIGIYWAAQKFYPELFDDIDLKAKVQEFCRDFLHCTMTDEQYNQTINK